MALFSLLLPATDAFAETDCNIAAGGEAVTVRHVIDGDTVVLEDGRHVRLIGVNAPEMAREDRAAEPFAEASRRALIRMLDNADGGVRLKRGVEDADRYGRVLGHLFSPTGEHLGARLIRQGLAFAIAVPPNLGFQACLREAENEARNRGHGLWSKPDLALRSVENLGSFKGGFVRVRGRLDGVGFSRDALWLQIGGHLGVRIHKTDLVHFRRWNFHSLQGQEVVVRGWISPTRRGLRMRLKHPNDLEIGDGMDATPSSD